MLGITIQQVGSIIIGRMPVREQSLNAAGNLHGGAISTLIDVTAGIAAARGSRFRQGENAIVAADIHVRFLGRATTDEVRAEAQVLRAGKQLVVVECKVLDSDDKLVATADHSSMIVALRQPLGLSKHGDPGSPDL